MVSSMGYEFLDCGEGKKLERFGKYILIRPSPIAIWPQKDPLKWVSENVIAEFVRSSSDGEWIFKGKKQICQWETVIQDICLETKLTPFGHVGLFPEHYSFWGDLHAAIDKHESAKVLNLFAYTGATSIFAAKHGATVVHVDSSKSAVKWAQKNVLLNHITGKKIFWVIEDVISFLKKEVKRGKTYDIIILDPPTYGRGAEGEIFKIEDHFYPLLKLCQKLLSKVASFILVTTHTPGHTPMLLESLIEKTFPKNIIGNFTYGESCCGTQSTCYQPSGSYAKWMRL